MHERHNSPPLNHARSPQLAMEGQALEGSEILNVRWAHDDPNPVAREAVSAARSAPWRRC